MVKLNDFLQFTDLKRVLVRKKFKSNDEIISVTEEFFGEKEKSYYKSGIEKL